MYPKRKNERTRPLIWKIKKHYRWLKLNWRYMKRVLLTEREIGDELDACG